VYEWGDNGYNNAESGIEARGPPKLAEPDLKVSSPVRRSKSSERERSVDIYLPIETIFTKYFQPE
jgi:hypothetical protein